MITYKKRMLFLAHIVCLLIFILGVWFHDKRISLLWYCLFSVLLIIGIFVGLFFIVRIPEKRLWGLLMLLFNGSIFWFISLSLTNYSLSIIYAPPAITKDNFNVYSKCIRYLGHYENYDEVMLTSWGRLKYGEHNYNISLDDYVSFLEKDAMKTFPEEEIDLIKNIVQDMQRVKCKQFQKIGNVVLFYRYTNKIMANRHGVVYVFNNMNPNDMDNNIINAHKPFINIYKNWYTSSKMVYSNTRQGSMISTPYIFFDHSKWLSQELKRKIDGFH